MSHVFDYLAGSLTLNKQTQSPTQRDYGTFDPSLPFPPLWSEDGKTRYGFRRWFNGYVRGPEGTSLALLQAAVNAGMIPGVHQDASGRYPLLTSEDYFDAMYIAVGQTSLYDAYVRAVPSVDPSQPNFPPPLSPVNPVDPNPQSINPNPPADPCAAVKAAFQSQIALLQHSLNVSTKAYEADEELLSSLETLVNGLKFPAGNTGGVAWVALRKIRKALAG
jgi:hypothetical protein